MEPVVGHETFKIFKVLGHPLRLEILEALTEAEMTHKELQRATGNLQLSLWRLLEELIEQGLVEKIEVDRRDVRYKAKPEGLRVLGQILAYLVERCETRDSPDE